MQKKVGFSNTSNIQGDKLIINNGLTSSFNLNFKGGSTLTFSLPTADGSPGYALITNGSGQLSFGTVSSQGNVQVNSGSGSAPKLAYWTGSQSLSSSLLEQGSGQLLFPSGTLTAPGVSFLLDTDTGIRRPSANQVAIVGGGVDLANFNQNGVTIGAVTYTDNDTNIPGYVLASDGAGNTYWTENIIGTTGPTGPTGSYITGGYQASQTELVFQLNTGGTISVTGSFAGTSGTRGTSGTSGNDGSSGTSGSSGSSGISGSSGNTGTSGTSGSSGQNGSSGTSGTSGTRGTSGTSGNTGSSGTSGSSGQNGSSGTSGSSGQNGSSGTTGTSGTSGTVQATFIDGWLNTASYSTQIIALTNSTNWTAGNTFSGTMSGTYQGQRYFNGPYIYDAIADNQWIRILTGGVIGATGATGTSGTSGSSGHSGQTGTSGTSGTGTSGTSGASGLGNATAIGTTNYIAKFTGATALGNSLVIDNGTIVNIPSYAQAVTSNTSVTGAFTQSLSNSNTYAYTLTGDTTFGYSNPTMSVYNFVVKGATYTFTLNSTANWQTVGATALGFTGSFVMSCIYDGTDMWVSTVRNYQSY